MLEVQIGVSQHDSKSRIGFSVVSENLRPKRNVVVLGLGRISKKHIDAIEKSDFFQLSAGVDPVETAREEFEEATGVKALSSLDDAHSALENADLAVIANESGGHFKLAMQLVGLVPNLLVEKPLTLRAENSRKLIDACESSGTSLNIVQQNRLNPPVQKLLSAIASGALGKIHSANVQVLWNREEDYYNQAEWRGTWEWDGGVMSNQANHHLDLLRLIMGKPKSAKAFIRNTRGLTATDDLASGVIEFESGAVSVFELTTAARPKNVSSSISVVGEFGVIEIGGVALNKVISWTIPETTGLSSKEAMSSSEEVDGVYGFGHQRLYNHLEQNWGQLPTPVTSPESGFENVDLVERLYESAILGKEVYFDEKSQEIPLGRLEAD